MNATNANPTSLQAEQKAHEPSMEDILASIRKIIADDDALPISRRAARAAPAPAKVEPAWPEPGAIEPSGIPAEPPMAAPPRVFAPHVPTAFAAPADIPLKPPPIPNLRDLALRLDSIPLRSAPQEEFAPAPPELRPSLEDAILPDARLPDPAGAESPSADAIHAPAAPRPAAPAPVVRARPTPSVSFDAGPAAPAPSVHIEARPATHAVVHPVAAAATNPEPVAAKASVGFAAGGFKVPPLAFQASMSSAAVSLAPADPVAPASPVAPANTVAPAEPQAPVAAGDQPANAKAAAPATASLFARMGLPAPRLDRLEPAMLSENSGFKVGAAFDALAESALLRDPEMVERLTREILRPMIKTWLDDNLPNVVERLVRAEIERVARGPRG